MAESQRLVDTPLNVSCLLILFSILTAFSMTRVLIVEDQRTLLDTFTRGLREEGYAVDPAANVAEARRVLKEEAVDAIILDLMLPDGDGLSLLCELRQAGFSKPIVIVTARDAVEDRVHGLDSGADDYLVKPFSFDELLARLRAVLRRSGTARESVLRVDDLELDLLNRRVTRAGCELELTLRQIELLTYLMRTAGESVTREMIAQNVWKEPTATWTNVIEVQINHLRRKIERPEWPPILHTIRGEGYVLGVRP